LTLAANSNFSFLIEHDALFVELTSAAERSFSSDPNTTLLKLRQFAEALAQHIAVLSGITFDEQTTQADLLYKLNRELGLEPQVKEFFHILRIEGNKATHKFKTQHREALDGLKVARALAIWFHQSFGAVGTSFKAGAFIPPVDPSSQLRQLQQDIERLKDSLTTANIQLDSSQQFNELIAKEKAEYEALALAMDEEAKQLAQQAALHEAALEQQQQDYEAKIQQLQQQIASQAAEALNKQLKRLTSSKVLQNKELKLPAGILRLMKSLPAFSLTSN